jgi:hypothetical protein
LIDDASDKELIDPRLRRMLNGKIRKKQQDLTARDIKGQIIAQVTHETTPMRMTINRHEEMISFDEMEMPKQKIVLGAPWLERHNPEIDWVKKEITFSRCDCQKAQVRKVRMEDQTAREDFCFMCRVHGPFKPGNCPSREHCNDANRITTEEREPWEKVREQIPKELWKYKKVFMQPPEKEELPQRRKWDHEIPLKEGEHPKKLPIYSMSPGELKELKEYLDSNIRRGYIRPSTSEAGYPVIFVPKKDKYGKLTKRRMCVDYRQLNSITKKNRYPLPLIEELQDRLQGAKWFTKLDIREGYYKIRIKEGDEWKTAFRTRYGLYEYQVMPFGLTNAPATFQGLINHTLYDCLDDYAVAYLDDVLIFSRTFEEHQEHVMQVLERLQRENLTLKPEKCEFYTQETEYLGHLVTPEGLKMHPDKIKAILEYPTPTTQKEILAFQGLAGYYRRFITGFSGIMAPITDLLKKEKKFEWTTAQEQAFQAIKDKFQKEPVLVHFNYEKAGVIDADASKKAIGARLQQADDQGRMRLVACYTRKLSPTEQNYDIHDREMLAIVEALERWRSYLSGAQHQTLVKSDHKNLQYFMTTKKLNGRQARWAETLAEYDFTIQHCKGKDNAWADALSRRPDLMEGEDNHERPALLIKEGKDVRYNSQETLIRITSVETLMNEIRTATQKDKYAQRLLNEGKLEERDGILLFEGLVYVPRKYRTNVIREKHDAPSAGHFGIERTIEQITREYYFPGIRKEVEKHIRKCDICNRAKTKKHLPYGKLQPLEIPEEPWRSIAMDFIVKLPKSREPMTNVEYDAIFTVVDRLTKQAYFIPFLEEAGAEETAYIFHRHITGNHGTPEETISDRDTRFRSKFWQELMALAGTKSKLSTAFHPQTDGITERMNQTIEQYLRCYVNYQQDDWVKWLPIAQFAYNNSTNSATGITPYYANYGREMKAFRNKLDRAYRNVSAQLSAEEMKQLHNQMARDLRFVQKRMQQYYDRRHEDVPTIRAGQKVYLLRKNLKTKRPSDKLDFKKLGPFRVIEQTGPVNFKLKLPQSSKIHPVFHAAVLEPASDEIPEANIMDAEGYEDQEYTVERILAKRGLRGQEEYLVKWKDYEDSENSWEPVTGLMKAQQAIRTFHQKSPRTPKTRGRAQRSQ